MRIYRTLLILLLTVGCADKNNKVNTTEKTNQDATRLSWMTDEMVEEIKIRDEIVKNEDFESLFSLHDDGDFSIVLHEILVNRYDKNPNDLSQVQLNLFLCMHMENAGQSDTILTFLQEWFPQYNEQVIISLREIGAFKSSSIIKQAVELLPKDGSWFFKSSNESSEKVMMELGRNFSSYPDGPMSILYYKYANKHRNEVVK
ncbi:hypothetical protein SAMN04488007_0911 [Maribacter aquivivus]|uniref:DNA mimic protein DMP19 C-terminal domain-containing protein n=1 Tax=Maribacter aquivivus TaxID=228958 RepID=A0A1M6KTU7_9FLAO|nr:hypothetical protein [Maribacter aquivivus]SHJ62329.1 hypothetical protein SAMN04488007_0911 [Maribacter aquivivus]